MAAEKFIAAASTTDDACMTWRHEWAFIYLYLANAKAQGGESWSPEAIDLLHRGRSMLESLIKAAPEMTVLFGELASSFQDEIVALKKNGKETEAAALTQEKERVLATVLASRSQDPWLLVQAYQEDFLGGDQAKSEGRLNEALGAYRRGTEKIEHAVELGAQNVRWLNYLGTAHETVAKLLEDAKNSKEALGEYMSASEALERAEKLDPDTPIYPDRLYSDYGRIAELKDALGDVGAEAALRAAADASQRAFELDKSATRAKNAAAGLEQLANFYEDTGTLDKALRAYELAGKNADRATELYQSDEYCFWQASRIHRDIGRIREKTDAAEKARADYQAALVAGQRAVDLKSGDGENWRALYLAQWFLAANIRGSEDKAAAKTLFRGALQNAQKAAELLPEDQAIKQHVISLQAEVKESSR